MVFAKNDKYVPRKDGKPSFNAGPKIVYVDRVVWNFIPDPATASAALTQGEIDWWENPTIDLVPQLKRNKDITLAVKDRTGEIGCLRFNHLHPPFDNAGDPPRRGGGDGPEGDHGGGRRRRTVSLIKTDVGIFVPGTPMASTVGVEVTRGPKDYDKLKQDLAAAGYKGEKIVDPRGLHHSDDLGRGAGRLRHAEEDRHEHRLPVAGMGHRGAAARQPGADRQGRLEHLLHVSRRLREHLAGAEHHVQEQRHQGNWFGWPTDPKMEALRAAWFDAPDVAAQKKICEEMQVEFWKSPPYAPLGMYDQPTAFRNYLQDVHDGWPQFYGVKKNA